MLDAGPELIHLLHLRHLFGSSHHQGNYTDHRIWRHSGGVDICRRSLLGGIKLLNLYVITEGLIQNLHWVSVRVTHYNIYANLAVPVVFLLGLSIESLLSLRPSLNKKLLPVWNGFFQFLENYLLKTFLVLLYFCPHEPSGKSGFIPERSCLKSKMPVYLALQPLILLLAFTNGITEYYKFKTIKAIQALRNISLVNMGRNNDNETEASDDAGEEVDIVQESEVGMISSARTMSPGDYFKKIDARCTDRALVWSRVLTMAVNAIVATLGFITAVSFLLDYSSRGRIDFDTDYYEIGFGILFGTMVGVIEYKETNPHKPGKISRRTFALIEFFKSYLGNFLAGDFLIRTVPELLFHVNDGEWAPTSWIVASLTVAPFFSFLRSHDSCRYRYSLFSSNSRDNNRGYTSLQCHGEDAEPANANEGRQLYGTF